MDGGGSGLTKGQALHHEEMVMERMCQDLEDMKLECYDKNSRRIAENLLKNGMSVADVAKNTELDRAVVEELAAKKGK